jgi:hypothetical protein
VYKKKASGIQVVIYVHNVVLIYDKEKLNEKMNAAKREKHCDIATAISTFVGLWAVAHIRCIVEQKICFWV